MRQISIKKKTKTLLLRCLYGVALSSFNVSGYAMTTVDLPQWHKIQINKNLSFRGSAIKGDSLWVTGSNNSVFVSQDGGKTWHDKSIKASLITDFRDIELFDTKTAIVMGVGNGVQSVLYKTTDGGNSWNLLYQNADAQGFFDSIAFWDNNHGVLLGDPVDGYYTIKLTKDGGTSWQRIDKKNIPEILEKEAAFAASGNTLIVGKQGKAWITTGGFSASVYESDDYGQTWQRQTVPLYNETQTAGGYGLALNHQQQLFVLGGDYQQRPAKYSNMATYLNGQWQAVNAGENGLRTAMRCEGNICIATGKTSSDISYNAGKRWQAFDDKNLSNLKSTKGDRGFYTLASDNMVFLAAGAHGKIGVLSFKRNDKGVKDVKSRLKK
ncbi:WD40/YVTN/BNR-like repeat-containing protein [Thalassotalea profundi]|uniref:Oxidoreductase n=1 Tax=Thalassotalea profundi TaxID=2036687 RepID=A0ABQ3IRE4_9GAMM|nr:oxidoreductase [Thalassotalea profundi]GHE91749.1 oxidoreductase [Thalassotalea profundi]